MRRSSGSLRDPHPRHGRGVAHRQPVRSSNLLIARARPARRATRTCRPSSSVTDWDLVVVDEAHKMAAHYFGGEVKKTQAVPARRAAAGPHPPPPADDGDAAQRQGGGLPALPGAARPRPLRGQARAMTQLPDVDRRDAPHGEGGPAHLRRQAAVPRAERRHGPLRADSGRAAPLRGGHRLRPRGDEPRRAIEQGGEAAADRVGFALTVLQRRLASRPRRSTSRCAAAGSGSTAAAARSAEGRPARRWSPADERIELADLDEFDDDDFDDEELEDLEDEVVDEATTAAADRRARARDRPSCAVLEALAAEVRASRHRPQVGRAARHPAGRRVRRSRGEPPQADRLHRAPRHAQLPRRPDPHAARPARGGRRHPRRRAPRGAPRDPGAFRNDPTSRSSSRPTPPARAQPPAAPPDGQLRPAVEPEPHRAALRAHPPHRPDEVCHLWNLVADDTREGEVFERLLDKIEEQRRRYGGQVFDVLGDSRDQPSLQDLLIEAIRYGERPGRASQTSTRSSTPRSATGSKTVLDERALASERARPRRHRARSATDGGGPGPQAPAALHPRRSSSPRSSDSAGGSRRREAGRFEITHVPGRQSDPATASRRRRTARTSRLRAGHLRQGPRRSVDGQARAPSSSRPATRCSTRVIDTILDRHGATLPHGHHARRPDRPSDDAARCSSTSSTPSPTAASSTAHRRSSPRRFQFVEVDRRRRRRRPRRRALPRLRPARRRARRRSLAGRRRRLGRRRRRADRARAGPSPTSPPRTSPRSPTSPTSPRRPNRARRRGTPDSEIRYWDHAADELKEQELAGKKPRLNSGRARQRADDLEARLRHAGCASSTSKPTSSTTPPTVVARSARHAAGTARPARAAARRSRSTRRSPSETDRRAVDAVLAAERALGRDPDEQAHNNPGFDILSEDPATAIVYFIEVKGHRPDDAEIRSRRPRSARLNRTPSASVSPSCACPTSPTAQPDRPLLRSDPFDDVRAALRPDLRAARTSPTSCRYAVEPQ